MLELKKNSKGIYYLCNYIPYRDFEYRSEEEISISKAIWDYKDGKADAFYEMTAHIQNAVWQFGTKINGKKFALVSVPPSKVDKESPIAKSIEILIKTANNSMLSAGKELVDYSKLLVRDYDIKTSHIEGRVEYDEKLNSTKCTRKDLSKEKITFVVMDDVTTSGDTLKACAEVLKKHGVPSNSIILFALANTKSL